MQATGRYFDGRTPQPWVVTVLFGGEEIGFTRVDGSLVRWAVADIRHEMPDGTDGAVRLTCADGAEALVIDDDAVRRWVVTLRIGKPRDQLSQKKLLYIAGTIVAALAVFAVAWSTSAPLVLAKLMPMPLERAIGATVETELALALSATEHRKVLPCTNAHGMIALDRLVARLARVSGSAYPLDIAVIDSTAVNALTLPGGRIVVLRGLIAFAHDGDELAGVLAHEIGHVVHRDAIRGIMRNAGLSALIELLTGGAQGGGSISALGRTLVTSAYSREAEAAADATGARLLVDAGIGTEGLARFFDRVAARQGELAGPLQLVASHPLSTERAAMLRALGHHTGRPAISAADWSAIRTMCRTAR